MPRVCDITAGEEPGPASVWGVVTGKGGPLGLWGVGTLLLTPGEALPQACWPWDLAKPSNPASGKRGGWKEAGAHRAAGLEPAGQRGWRPGLPTSPGPRSASPLLHLHQ